VNLEQIQRTMFDVIRRPLTEAERMRPRLPNGRSTRKIAAEIIKPNDRLASWERLEIYNQQYWYRLLSSLAEDFVGLRAVIGDAKYEKLAVAYINDCPSESFTLRNLGCRLESWLRQHPQFVAGCERLAVDMVRLEWAEIEAFDGPQLPAISPQRLRALSGKSVFRLQPHLQLLDLEYPVDDLLLRVRRDAPATDIVSNAVLEFPRPARRRRLALPKPKPVFLAVYRLRHTVYFKRLPRNAFALLRALKQGKTLEQAIEAAPENRGQSTREFQVRLQKWFRNWAALGWFGQPE
jgi:hypothetical protein